MLMGSPFRQAAEQDAEGAVERVDGDPATRQPGPRVTAFPSTATSE